MNPSTAPLDVQLQVTHEAETFAVAIRNGELSEAQALEIIIMTEKQRDFLKQNGFAEPGAIDRLYRARLRTAIALKRMLNSQYKQKGTRTWKWNREAMKS